MRRRVTREGKIPSNWRNTLRDDSTADLFNCLADSIACGATPNVVIVTKEEDAVSNRAINLAGVASSKHEEDETGIFLHARPATEAGSSHHDQSQ